MGDAIGQASAMTGGYGNSYAQSVGQQMYQKELQNLNDIVPELYQMALDKYKMEGQELYNQYGMLSDDYNREYGMYTDQYGRLMDALGIARGDYYDGADMHYTEQNNKNNVAGMEFDDAMSIWNAENTTAWNEAEWNRDQTWRDEDITYRDSRDKVEDERYDAAYGNKTSGGSTGGSSGGGSSSGGSSGGSGSGTGSGNGGSKPTTQTTTSVPDSIKQKAASFTSNDALDDYLTKQYQAGKITEEQMGELYLENEISSLTKRNWTLVDDGGVNWLWGVDNNAVVKDQYGNSFKLDKLVDALVSEGMSKSEAKSYVKKLQSRLGA